MKPPSRTIYNRFMSQFIGQPCGKCGLVYESNLGHHIIYKSQCGYLTLVFMNIIPLCLECHAEAHKAKFVFFEWLDDKYPGRLESLNEIKQECQRERYSHEEIFEKWGRP
jgi:hypothetical protein